MSTNIVNHLLLREVGSRNICTLYKAQGEIDYLFQQECFFDHPFITDIYILLRKLIAINMSVRNKVLNVNWERDFSGLKSIVLLARKIARETDLNIPEIKILEEMTLIITDDDFLKE